MAVHVLVCVEVKAVKWVVSTHYHYKTQSLIGILRRKLILPSAVALACLQCMSVFVYFHKKVANFHFQLGFLCALTFEGYHDDAMPT